MCPQNQIDRPVSINGVQFTMISCTDHTHGVGDVVMPSGGRVTIVAMDADRTSVIEKLGPILYDIMRLAQLERENPGIHPFALASVLKKSNGRPIMQKI